MLTQDEAKRNLADNLGRILRDRKLKPLELSRRAEVPQATIYAILHAKHVPSAVLLLNIAETLDVSTDRLLQTPPEPPRAAAQKIA